MSRHLPQREPSLPGVPTFFRACVEEARQRRVLGRDTTGVTARASYFDTGWHLALHAEDRLTEEAREDLVALSEIEGDDAFDKALLAFLDRELPDCMALVPAARRAHFLDGVLHAIQERRFTLI